MPCCPATQLKDHYRSNILGKMVSDFRGFIREAFPRISAPDVNNGEQSIAAYKAQMLTKEGRGYRGRNYDSQDFQGLVARVLLRNTPGARKRSKEMDTDQVLIEAVPGARGRAGSAGYAGA